MPDYRAIATAEAVEAGIPVGMFLAQIDVESGFDPGARSERGAIGIAQIMPRWHPAVDANDPIASLRYAAQLMARFHARYGRWDLSLAAYNAGGPTVDGLGGIPPGEATAYVAKVFARWTGSADGPPEGVPLTKAATGSWTVAGGASDPWVSPIEASYLIPLAITAVLIVGLTWGEPA